MVSEGALLDSELGSAVAEDSGVAFGWFPEQPAQARREMVRADATSFEQGFIEAFILSDC